jgi:phage repressor protein C with HTH and peptisase S24 domain
MTFHKSWFVKNGYSPDKLVAVKVRGESMETTLHENDTVVVNTADRTPKDGEVFAVNYEGEAVIKRMVRDIGQWWLSSDNPDQRKYHRKVCQGDACIIIGKVILHQTERI